jgi:hypothetical protein
MWCDGGRTDGEREGQEGTLRRRGRRVLIKGDAGLQTMVAALSCRSPRVWLHGPLAGSVSAGPSWVVGNKRRGGVLRVRGNERGEIQWHGRERVQPRVIGERDLNRAQPGSTESG